MVRRRDVRKGKRERKKSKGKKKKGGGGAGEGNIKRCPRVLDYAAARRRANN